MEEYSLIHPKYVSDTIKLETIFSEKVWLQIFKNISESDHYHSIFAGSPYFQELLLPLRTHILFPEVIKLLTKSKVLTEKSYSALLLYRSVCKSWKHGVDAKIQDILNEFNTDATNWKFFGYGIGNLNPNQERIMIQPKIYNQNKLDQFLETFHNSHFLTRSNPFPSRSIHIQISSNREIPSNLFDVLEIYGHHIWHCFIFWLQNPEEMQQQFQIFCKVLLLLPNLQTLRIGGLTRIENAEHLENMLSANTLPKFKNLKFLEDSNVAGPIFSQLIQNNPHIKNLSVSNLDFKVHSALFTTPLPNLEEFHLMGFKSAENFTQLQSIQVQWPLKKLTFSFFCNNRDVLDVNHVFNWITARWSETLTDLSIIIPSSVSVFGIKSSAKLPNLKNLKIKLGCHDCLDFILSLSKSLVSLSVHRHHMKPHYGGLDKESKIQFFCHKGNLRESNVWKVFPRLKEIYYADDSWPELTGGRHYTRDQLFATKINKEETIEHATIVGYSFNSPKYFSDVIKLQVIFSEKIWLLIFQNISESDQYHSFCATSPYFHKLLLPLRTQILFPDIIKLCSNPMVSTTETYFLLLKFRTACKVWKQGVDAALHHILSDTNTDGTDWKNFGCPSAILNRNQERIFYLPDIYDKNKLDRFLGVFHNSHFPTRSNPFPSRSILIHTRSKLTIFDKLFDILQVYGHHIWHCYAILLYQDAGEMQEEMQMFSKLLCLLPNLQTLRVYNVTGRNRCLERILSAHPMPKLKSLKLLANHHIPGAVFSQLIQNNTHIKMLRMSEVDFNNLSELISLPLLNLEELHILGFKRAGDFLGLLNVAVQSPLKKLTILGHDSVPHVSNVFSWMDLWWAETLTDLSIIIPSSVTVSEIESSLKFPSLKNLRIKMWRFASLDFILHFTNSLVSLGVYHHGRQELEYSVEKDSKIRFFSHRHNLGKSNIWKFFPKLREIKYADRSVDELSVERTYRRNQ